MCNPWQWEKGTELQWSIKAWCNMEHFTRLKQTISPYNNESERMQLPYKLQAIKELETWQIQCRYCLSSVRQGMGSDIMNCVIRGLWQNVIIGMWSHLYTNHCYVFINISYDHGVHSDLYTQVIKTCGLLLEALGEERWDDKIRFPRCDATICLHACHRGFVVLFNDSPKMILTGEAWIWYCCLSGQYFGGILHWGCRITS